MMPPEPSFEALMQRLRSGDQDAAAEVFHRFARRLIGLARARLDHLVRQKMDPEEIVQSVYKSFFLRFAEGQYDLKSWDSLWALLTLITVRKCGHRIEYFHAACRDVRHEASQQIPADDSTSSWEAIARDPTPAEAAMLADTVAKLMRILDGRDRQIVSLTLQGQTPPAVSAEVGCSERTVRRVLDQVKKWLQRRESCDTQDP
jgi:RNA polymerase sigma-70 factor (ECF subfamily)